MKPLKILLAVVVGGVAVILAIGAMLPETERDRARRNCDTLDRLSYTQADKALSDNACAELRRDADRRMGRLPPGAP